MKHFPGDGVDERDDRAHRRTRTVPPLPPGLADADIKPATLAPELLQDLLRGELGFNGLILTGASQMIGLTQTVKRRDLVRATIAAGCDMFLVFRNPAEDFGYMLDGYTSGVITEQRLHDALRRIPALNAALGLRRKERGEPVPSPWSSGTLWCRFSAHSGPETSIHSSRNFSRSRAYGHQHLAPLAKKAAKRHG